MSIRKKILIASGVVAFMLTLLAFGTIDYDVSMNLVNKESLFGEFFNRHGEFPVGLVMLIGVGILFATRKKEKTVNNILGYIFAIPFMFLFSFFIGIMPFNYAYEHTEGSIPSGMFILAIVISVVIFTLSLIVIKKMGRERLMKYRKIALLFVLLGISSLVVVNVVKIIWARPRMRSISSIEEFKYWFEINGLSFDNELKSFPSGHTANGFLMVALAYLLPTKVWRNRFMIFGIAWGSCVALSRVILGAHFLSDVIVGGFATIVVMFILEHILLKNSDLNVS
ncbi:MAG: phosphatase PAP2 family protein [Clostridiales bacterium]|nr:phosphatase PAP2 family protein [Clostridiales bacterium]